MGQVKTHSGARSRPNALGNLGRRASARSLPAAEATAPRADMCYSDGSSGSQRTGSFGSQAAH